MSCSAIASLAAATLTDGSALATSRAQVGGKFAPTSFSLMPNILSVAGCPTKVSAAIALGSAATGRPRWLCAI